LWQRVVVQVLELAQLLVQLHVLLLLPLQHQLLVLTQLL
jgi:hypothetical protein